jgi:hypothetical protein
VNLEAWYEGILGITTLRTRRARCGNTKETPQCSSEAQVKYLIPTGNGNAQGEEGKIHDAPEVVRGQKTSPRKYFVFWIDNIVELCSPLPANKWLEDLRDKWAGPPICSLPRAVGKIHIPDCTNKPPT